MAIEQLLTKIGQIEVDKDVIDKGKYAADEIEKYISQDIICKTELLNEICKNPNLLWANTINQLIQNRILSVGDLINAHIDKRFIEALGTNLSARTISPSGELTQIKRLSTEVYFWGIPASGKSCAIGAILSMASKRGSPLVNAFAEQPCQGIDYMMQLCEMFLKDDKVKPVPSGTPVRFTYEMSFTITDNNHRVHPITFIDMAGELIRCMYKKNAQQRLSDEEEKALTTVTNLLKDKRSTNQKLHFFVLEYGGQDRVYGNLTQLSLLRGAIMYLSAIPTTDGNVFNVFKEKTDGIYLLVTKSDKAKAPLNQLKDYLLNYINSPLGYGGIGDLLSEICRKYHINGGELEVVPFSLGKVCFKNFCIFEGLHTADVIDILVTRTWYTKDWLDKKWAYPIKKILNFLRS